MVAVQKKRDSKIWSMDKHRDCVPKRVNWTEVLARDSTSLRLISREWGDCPIPRQKECLFGHLQKCEDLGLRQGSVLDYIQKVWQMSICHLLQVIMLYLLRVERRGVIFPTTSKKDKKSKGKESRKKYCKRFAAGNES